jgi:hypothetical protein
LKNSSAERGPKIASRQDALQPIFSGRVGIFYPQKSSRFCRYRIFNTHACYHQLRPVGIEVRVNDSATLQARDKR